MEIKINKPSAMIQVNVKELSFTQRKIVNFMIYIAQKSGNQKYYVTDIKTIKKMCTIKSTENIDIKEQFRNLKNIIIEFNYLNKDKNHVWQSINFISAVEIIHNTGETTFEIPNMLKERILDPKIYAPLNILLIAGLKSKYSIVLYELLRDYLHSPTFPQLTVTELKELLGIGKGKYKEFFDFKKRVLDKAIKEINKKTDIICTYELIKTSGNRYSHIKFKVEKNINFKFSKPISTIENKDVPLIENKFDIPPEILKILPPEYHINSIRHQIEPYFNDLNFLASNIEYANKNCDKNYPAYLKLALKNDYAKVNREVKEKKNKIVQDKKNHIQEKKNQEKLLKQKAWDYFNSLPEGKQFKFRSDAEEKMSAALKFIKIPERRNDIITAQIEKDLLLVT